MVKRFAVELGKGNVIVEGKDLHGILRVTRGMKFAPVYRVNTEGVLSALPSIFDMQRGGLIWKKQR